jgi:hypothetical protein
VRGATTSAIIHWIVKDFSSNWWYVYFGFE